MAALLVGLSIMAVMMTVVMPVWKQTAQREKEEELIFRGKQYVHAIGLFQRKYANTPPPNVDVLVEQRFLRKKFKDPITNDDFVPIPVGQTAPGTGQASGGQRGAGGAASAAGGQGAQAQVQPQGSTQPGGGRIGGPPVSTTTPGQTSGGISGVASKSKDQSIRLYNGRGHYNEWAFVYIPQQQAPGAGGAPGTAAPGQGGQPGQQPGPLGPGGQGRGGLGGPNGRGPGRGTGGIGTFGGGGVTPVQPPSTPRGRF